jgi:hypothetical protein
VVSAIIDLLDMRFCLTERVFSHHAKCIASAMLARLARLTALSDADEPLLIQFGDEGFFNYLEDNVKKIESESHERGECIKRLLYCLRARRLYQRIFKVGRQARDNWDASRQVNAFCTKWRDGEAIEELLRTLEETHSLPLGSLVLWCPENRAGMKLVKAKVIYETSTGIQGPKSLREIEEFGDHFRGFRDRVKTIEDVYRDLWTFWIAIDRRYIEQAPDLVEALEEQLEIQCDRVFRDTYLDKLPGFGVRRKHLGMVKHVAADLLPEVMESVTQQSALSGEPAADEGAVLEAMKAAIEKRSPGKTPRKRTEQPKTVREGSLWDESKKGDDAKERKEEPK